MKQILKDYKSYPLNTNIQYFMLEQFPVLIDVQKKNENTDQNIPGNGFAC